MVGYDTALEAPTDIWVGADESEEAPKLSGRRLEDEGTEKRDPRSWPIVRFGSREVLCRPAAWEIFSADGLVQAKRRQVPLILAWAFSIHKSQGQTLDRVRVDLDRTFESGQGKRI